MADPVQIHAVKDGKIYASWPTSGGWYTPEQFIQAVGLEKDNSKVIEELKAEVRKHLNVIRRYPDHLPECLSQNRLTEEYCDCGFGKARAAFGFLWELTAPNK